MTFIFTLGVTLIIGSFMNIMLNTTKRVHWLGVIAFALFASIIITALLDN